MCCATLKPETKEKNKVTKSSGKEKTHKLKRILGTPAGCPWDTRQDKLYFCESVRPVQGPKTPKSGKEGFGVEKPPFPPHPRNGRFESKNPHFPCGAVCRNGDFFDSKHPFLGWGEMGVFRLRNPLFPILGFLAPVQGGRIRNFIFIFWVSGFQAGVAHHKPNVRAHQIGANPGRIRSGKFPGSGLKQFSELCVFATSPGT